MIAADASSLVAYLKGEAGRDVEILALALSGNQLVLPPAVLTEVLSDPVAYPTIGSQVADLVLLEPSEGYWDRAGAARRTIHAHGLKARTADALIAQSCIDAGVALITRDRDFRHFVEHCGLQLA
ncbi:MAG: PIN domain-containing protein [Bauldia sp.]|nr:PIN domain-containing protein [Bauldia sp.]